jgi:hypothetical protein
VATVAVEVLQDIPVGNLHNSNVYLVAKKKFHWGSYGTTVGILVVDDAITIPQLL